MKDGNYENMRRITYGEGTSFIPVCQKCKRFVKIPKTAFIDGEGTIKEPEVECAKCGKSKMIFEGYF